MDIGYEEVRVRGRDLRLLSARISDRTVVVPGKWLKIASIKDEELVEGGVVPEPDSFVQQLKISPLKADLLNFPQHFSESKPKYPYPFEWDNVAAASTASFQEWWERKLPQEARKNARRAAKRGVSVQVAKLDDDFVKGIKGIYDESPYRQGMRFWHYGKDLDRIKLENGTYPERSEFIGAFFEGELIGFMKFVYVDRTARIMQILSKTAHYDKRPMNAMIAKAVEVCHEKGMLHLVYSKFSFGKKKNSQLAEFKRRNGFEEILFPRYYVPLTAKGHIGLKLQMHKSLIEILPSSTIDFLLRARSSMNNLLSRKGSKPGPAASVGRPEMAASREAVD